MTYGLPAHGEANWDTKVNDSIAAVKATADAAQLGDIPTWFVAGKPFDPTFGTYNFTARTLPRFRAARADAVAGVTPLRIAVLGDSTTARASNTLPAKTVSWPSRMRDQMLRSLGIATAGSGIIFLWNTAGEDLVEPRVARYFVAGNGTITDVPGYGPYGLSVVQVANGSNPGTRLEFIPGEAADEFWIYMTGGGGKTKVTIVNAGATITHLFDVGAYYGDASAPDATYTAAAPLDGYVRTNTPAVSGGLVVARLIVEHRSDWTCQVRSAVGQAVYVHAVESRDSTVAAGMTVSDVAQGGVGLSALVVGTEDSAGQSGLPLGIDTVQADLYILALGLNDWQGHGSVATFKSQLTTTVQRAKATAATGTYGHGTAPAADVVLMVMPEPDYTAYPTDHVQTPPLSDYWQAMYQVASEQDVALIDNSYRWVSYASSTAIRADGIHPSPSGAADIGASLGALLATV